MDPVTMAMIGSAAAPAVGGIVGNLMGKKDRDRANAAIQQALAQYAGLNIPDTEKMKLALESPSVQGILAPYMQQAEQLQGTAQADIQIDPRLKQAQMQALETLSRMGAEGLTAEDRAALNLSRRQTAGDEQSRQEGILQNMAARGAGGSGVELATRLASSQASADRAGQESDRLMAMAQRRMLEGVSAAGQAGGQIRAQDYGEQSDLARAKDAIAQFNAQQKAATQSANIGQLNEAQLRNLAEKQRISEAGISTRNMQQQYNKELQQKEFDNRMQLATAKANALAKAGTHYQTQAGQTAGMWQGIGSGIGQVAGGIAAMKDKK